MKRKILTILGLFVLFDLVLVGAVFFMLPTNEIARLAEKNIEKALKQEQTVKIEDLSISPLMTATVEKFSLSPRNAAPIDESLAMEGGTFSGFYCAPYVEPQPVVIDEIFVNPDVFASLSKKYGGSFELKIQQGKVTGDVKTKGSVIEVKANGETISLNDFALFSNLSGMQIYGELGFTLRAILNAGLNPKDKTAETTEEEEKTKTEEDTAESADNATEKGKRSGRKNRPNRPNRKSHQTDNSESLLAEAHVNLNTSMTAICPKRLKLGGIPLDLPFTVFGNIEAELEVKDNKLIIHKLTSDGPDIKLDITGDVMLKSKTNASPRLNIHAVILPSETWVTENDMKVIYQMCEKHPDGSIELDLKGSVKRLKHECGTPIPEPVTEKPQKDEKSNDKSDNTKDDKSNKAKETKSDNTPSETERAKPASGRNRPERRLENNSDEQAVNRAESPSGRPARMMGNRSNEMRSEGGMRGPGRDRNSQRPRTNMQMPSDFRTRNVRVNQDMENIQNSVEADIRRHGRGRERMPSRNFDVVNNEE